VFELGQLLYQQVFGTAMGSPVSPVIANLVMKDVEQRAFPCRIQHIYNLFYTYSYFFSI
jgi:hypothetical protein